ncbi:helix-turn-helix transcriptional regulator [Paraburkholderia bannensis]|uniref:helix-turn-helix transcriptional regulator n=1 Tax=Paraburkholderia bannensis TaxID=765414 RepID=UPI002AC33593|nr:helix-turn-helix transcriptional regulator [Paraburkholderia bannensis]
MKSNESEYDCLLHGIYATLERPAAWKDFCAQLREALGVASIQLSAFDRQRELFSWADGFTLMETEPLEFIPSLYRDDARLEWLRACAPGKWLYCCTDAGHSQGQAVFEPCLLAGAARFVSLCKLIDSGTLTAMIACRRNEADGPLPEAGRALLERLTPHLIRAMRLSLRRLLPDADTLAGQARPPAMLVSAMGEVLNSNEPAQRLLRATSLVRVRSKRIALAAPYQARFLEDVAISEARLKNHVSGARAAAARLRALRIVSAADRSGSAGSTQRASDDAESTLPAAPEVLYAFYNVVTPGEASTADLRAMAAVTFYHPRSAPAVDEQVLATAFDLSPAECRIVHLLVDGFTPKEIATRVSVQYDTVRKQLQSIYLKTATRRQPDLLRLLMNLPARGRPGVDPH